MSKPRLLDLFCGAGGAAMGYSRAGFDVVGMDIEPQKNYPFEFFKADALGCLRSGGVSQSPYRELTFDAFDAIHASPPCQAYSITKHSHKVEHPDLLGPTRLLLQRTGLPWVIENVIGAPMEGYVTLCGAGFELQTVDDGISSNPLVLKRHRQFESNLPIVGNECLCREYKDAGFKIGGVYGGGSPDRWHAENVRHGGYTPSKGVQERLMGIDWMTQKELNQAIPPAYTEFIGSQLLQHLGQPLSSPVKEGL